jgi:hypothetical protein
MGRVKGSYDHRGAHIPFPVRRGLAEVRRIVGAEREFPTGTNLTMNLLVTETPFAEDRRLSIAMQQGGADWITGHVDDADLLHH